MRTTPRLGRSRVPMTWSRVLLPDPDGPTMATSSPWSIAQVDAGQGHDRGVAGVLLHHVDQLEDRRRGMRLGREREGRVRDDQGHDDGTWTRMPTLMPEPLDLDQVVGVEAGRDPDEMAGAAGHHVHAVATALEGQAARSPARPRRCWRRLRGDVDVHRSLVQGGQLRGAVQGDGDRHRRGRAGAASARRAGRRCGRAAAVRAHRCRTRCRRRSGRWPRCRPSRCARPRSRCRWAARSTPRRRA